MKFVRWFDRLPPSGGIGGGPDPDLLHVGPDLLGGGIGEERFARWIGKPDTHGKRIEHGSQPQLAVSQRFFRAFALDHERHVTGERLRDLTLFLRQQVRGVVIEHECSQQSVRGQQRDKSQRPDLLGQEYFSVRLHGRVFLDIGNTNRRRIDGLARPWQIALHGIRVLFRETP